MITKKYIADSEVVFNIRNGKVARRIAFRPISRGMSVYVTSNTDEQTAIERHHFFGNLFRLDSEVRTGEDTQPIIVNEKAITNIESEQVKILKEAPEIDNCPDAKNFLVNLGWTGKATSKAALKSIAAEKYGYDFINLK